MVLPAMGMLSEIIPVFSRKPIFGYKAIAFSTIGIAFASMLVWAHHMFTVGLAEPAAGLVPRHLARGGDPDRDQDLQLARDALARPPHLSRRRCSSPRLHRPLHDGRPLGDHARRLPGRLPGARLVLRRRALPLRALRRHGLRDLRGALLLVPQDHRPDVQRAARQVGTSGCIFVGFNAAFLPQHMLGLMGMPRRVYTYERGRALRVVQPHLHARLLHHGSRILIFLVNAIRRAGAAARASATTRGAATRSSGTRPPRRRLTTSTACPTSRAPRPLRDLRLRLGGAAMSARPGPWLRLTALAGTAGVARSSSRPASGGSPTTSLLM